MRKQNSYDTIEGFTFFKAFKKKKRRKNRADRFSYNACGLFEKKMHKKISFNLLIRICIF